MNKSAERLTGRSRNDLIGRTVQSVFPELLNTALHKACQRALDEQTPVIVEEEFTTTRKLGEIHCCPCKPGLAITIRDITQLKHQEEVIFSTSTNLNSIIQDSADGICFLAENLTIDYANQAFLDIFGFTEEELLGHFPRNIPPELWIEAELLFRQALQGKRISGFETKRVCKDGTVLDMSLTLSPIFDQDKEIRSFCVISRDISRNKRMERELRQSEEKYRIIAENTKDLITLLDTGFRIRYASPSHKEVLGFDPEEVVGLNVLDGFEEPLRSQVSAWLRRVLEHEDAGPFEIELPYPWGGGKLVEMNAVPISHQDGAVQQVLMVSRDISERKKTEELLRQSEKLSVAGQLAAGIAHEIRNPLTALKGFTQMMRGGSQYKAHYLDIMMSELTRIEQIISELLLLARPQAVTYQLKPIEPIIRDVVSLLESQAHMNNVQLEVLLGKPLPSIHCEENQLKQVFINIIKNALEAMPQGGIITIMAAQTANRSVSVSFQDSGPGIPENMLKRLGEPFYTTKEKGSGLGIMVSKKIVNEHRGTLTITSRPEHGTSVNLTFPIDPFEEG